MRWYKGKYVDGDCQVLVHDGKTPNTCWPLNPRFDLREHSPTGFQWGYLGSGPAQLALALCAEATGDDVLALDVYQMVKQILVAKLPQEDWRLTQEQVLDAVKQAQAHGHEV